MARFHKFLLACFLAGILPAAAGADNDQRKVRKVLTLDHHHNLGRNLVDRSLRSHDGSSTEHGGSSGATSEYNSGNAASQDDKRTGPGPGPARTQGGGFLGDGLNLVGGRAAHQSGGASSTDGGSSRYGNSAPSPTYRGSRSGEHMPVLPSSSHDGGKGKGGKGKKHSKSKSKSKGKKSKGKGGKHKKSEYEEGGGSIGGGMGADTIHPGGDSADGGNGPMPPTEETLNLTPFGILYDLADDIPTPSSEDYGMAIEVTVGYLNTYMSLQYEGKGLQDFQTTATSTIYRDGVPQIDYTASATFRAANTPPLSKLANDVAQAFSGANLALYLSMLQNLPDDNGFSTTTGARLTSPANLQQSSRSSMFESVSTAGKAGIAGAIGAGGLIIFAIGFMVYGSKQRRRPNSSRGERAKLTISNNKRATRMEQETTTCSSSIDGSRTEEDSSSRSSDSERIPISIGHRQARNEEGAAEGEASTGLSDVALTD